MPNYETSHEFEAAFQAEGRHAVSSRRTRSSLPARLNSFVKACSGAQPLWGLLLLRNGQTSRHTTCLRVTAIVDKYSPEVLRLLRDDSLLPAGSFTGDTARRR